MQQKETVQDIDINPELREAQTAELKQLLNGYRVKKSKGFPYSLPSVGTAADPGVQAVRPQAATWQLNAYKQKFSDVPTVTHPVQHKAELTQMKQSSVCHTEDHIRCRQ